MRILPPSFLFTGFVLLAATATAPAEPPLAFPGAEGAGKLTTGGRGGAVVHVTNLNADGPGSLADAVSQGDRIVVFDVSGIIDLHAGKKAKEGKKDKGGKIEIAHPNITVAGQTAPGEGICLKGGELHIAAGNVIVRYLRARRGVVRESDTGDCIDVKPPRTDVPQTGAGTSAEVFQKRMLKKESRGKAGKMKVPAPMENLVLDHCSTSWATDENLSVTHVDRSTISWCIAAEGLDYANPKQTPPNHSEGSLWGSAKADGRSTMHHMLYAHNRLRNPRTTGASDVPAVLNFYNNVVYDWSETASHTGKERVLLNWLANYYKPGPATPADIRTHMFEFFGDPATRIFASGNFVDGSPEATANNKLAIFHNGKKFKGVEESQREAMKADAPFPDAPAHPQSAADGYEAVLSEAGATLPARDAADLRIVNSVRNGTGRVIQKETDLPEDQRWPDYRSLPPPQDSDGDGLPDFWEKQFGLNPNDASDSAKISAGGYANIEHYFNNTDPTGGTTPIVFVSATVSRALVAKAQPGEWRITRTGDTANPLTVRYSVGGEAVQREDCAALAGSITIPAGAAHAAVPVLPLPDAHDNRRIILTITPEQAGCHIGCPSQSLIVIRK